MSHVRGWPTLGAYLDWARGMGCSVSVTDLPPVGVARYRCAVIENPAAGRKVAEVFIEETDPVASTSIARLDRRLGLKSHFFV